MIESNRDVLCIYTVVGVGVGVVSSSSRRRLHVRAARKSYDEEKRLNLFLVSSFNFFPTHLESPFYKFLLRAYRVRRTRNRRI